MNVKIAETSVKEMTARDRLKWEDVGAMNNLNDIEDGTRIDIANYAVLEVHNDALENPDYTCYAVQCVEGDMYKTSSESFYNDFSHKYEVLVASGEEDYLPAKVRRIDSKNYSGGKILLCGIE